MRPMRSGRVGDKDGDKSRIDQLHVDDVTGYYIDMSVTDMVMNR